MSGEYDRPSSAAEPVHVRIFARATYDGGIVAGRDMDLARATSLFGRTARSAPDDEFLTTDVRRDLGRVLFESQSLRDLLLRLVHIRAHVRLILDLEEDLSPLAWEAALAPDEFVDLGAPELSLGLWENCAVVRQSASYAATRTNNPVEPLFAPKPRAGWVDAREVGRARLIVDPPTEMRTPFRFASAPSARPEAFASHWFAECQVFHFVGHATPQGLDLGKYGIASWERVIAPNLSGELRLAVLEACSTGGTVLTGDRIPLAWKLATAVPGVVAMLAAIRSSSADSFIRAFYAAMSEGRPVDFAMADARWHLFQELGTDDAAPGDWMLPILFLSTPGSAAVPPESERVKAPEGEEIPAPLGLVAAADGGRPRRVVWRNGAIETAPLADRDRGPGPTDVVQSAPGGVSVVAAQGALRIRLGDAMIAPDPAFTQAVDAHDDTQKVIAVREIYGPLLEVITTGDAGTLAWVRDRHGRWGYPTTMADVGTLRSAVLLADGLIGVDEDGEYLLTDGRVSRVPDVEDKLERIIGIDAAEFGDHDLLAVWGVAAGGESLGAVFARRTVDDGEWVSVSDAAALRDVVRLGVPRSDRAIGASEAPGMVVVTRAPGRSVDVVALDLQGAR